MAGELKETGHCLHARSSQHSRADLHLGIVQMHKHSHKPTHHCVVTG